MSERVEALRRAVAAAPDDHALRSLLVDALVDADRLGGAVAEYRTLLETDALSGPDAVTAGAVALDTGDLAIARAFAARARDRGTVEGVAELERRIEAVLAERGATPLRAGTAGTPGSPPTMVASDPVTFADVGGLADVKKVIHRQVILPQSRGDLLRRYGRRAGGGVLLYGPPGCGKTLLARATAGECGVPFHNVRIEQILDPFLGNSERNLDLAFTAARSSAPSVLFIDEIDAIGYSRRKLRDGSAGRSLVDALLQQLDAIGSANDGLLVLASTNSPWDVDDALLRPGRFDRRVFVPPPDAPARAAVLDIVLADVPTERIDVRRVASGCELFSGADLRAVVDTAVDRAIDHALDTGQERPITTADLVAAADEASPTTIDWLETARSYVEFANAGDRYEAVASYLRSRPVRRRLGR